MMPSELNMVQSPVNEAVNDLMARMRLCVDERGKLINSSVKRGWDATLLSFVSGSRIETEDMPCIRIFSDTEVFPVESVQQQNYIDRVHLYVYFIYHFGHDEKTSFEEFRDSHIWTNIEWLRESKGFVPPRALYRFDNPQDISVEHTQAYRTLVGGDLLIKPPHFVSRFDLNLEVNNYRA